MSQIYGHDKSKFNIGRWMAARIYSDDRGNACKCGGKFASYLEMKRRDKESIFVPQCDKCQEPPLRYRIRTKLADRSGKAKYVFVRKNLVGQYLEDPQDVLDVFRRVEDDEKLGKFRYSDYDKKAVKEKDLFKNVVSEYIKIQSLRQDLSPYSLESKKKYSKILVKGVPGDKLDGFGEVSIHDIEEHHIEDFKMGLKSQSNKYMCLGEMKTILRWAKGRYKMVSVPEFEVASSKKRKTIPNIDQSRDKIIPAIENEMHREAIRMIAQYGFRPSEVRAIQYEQIDLIKERIIIDRHFSKTTLLMGRKSAAEGEETAILNRPFTPEFKAFIKSRPWPIKQPKKFLFTNSVGKPLGVKDLSKTWRETLKKLNLPPVEMYGLRASKITEVVKDHGIEAGRNFAGHTETRTTEKRYDFNDRNVDEFVG